MVSVQLEERVKVMETAPAELNSTSVQQVTDILDEAEKTAKTRQPATNHWYYSVPFAGVRYYSY